MVKQDPEILLTEIGSGRCPIKLFKWNIWIVSVFTFHTIEMSHFYAKQEMFEKHKCPLEQNSKGLHILLYNESSTL